MATMNAAVVTAFGEPPRYQEFAAPEPRTPDEAIVAVLAVGLHPRVRSGAAGTHYTSTGRLPLIPGVDAVGRRADGKKIYFTAADDVLGTMADLALTDGHREIELPAEIDDAGLAAVAAAMNPAMSSWVALRRRVPLEPVPRRYPASDPANNEVPGPRPLAARPGTVVTRDARLIVTRRAMP